jgi:hypothetical protein
LAPRERCPSSSDPSPRPTAIEGNPKLGDGEVGCSSGDVWAVDLIEKGLLLLSGNGRGLVSISVWLEGRWAILRFRDV